MQTVRVLAGAGLALVLALGVGSAVVPTDDVRPARASADSPERDEHRMGAYVPPCRVVTSENGGLSHGVHLDANGNCPLR